MKNTFFSLISLFFILLVAACGPSNRSIEETSLKQLMEIHDSTMSHSGYIIPLQDELRKLIDNPKTSETNRKMADSLYTQLSVSDKLMYDWMHNYKSDFSVGKDHDYIMKYLDSEIVKMKFVEKKTDDNLAAARKFLKK